MTGFEFGNLTKWTNFIVSMQSIDGPFYLNIHRNTSSLEASLHAVAALHSLNHLKKNAVNLVKQYKIVFVSIINI